VAGQRRCTTRRVSKRLRLRKRRGGILVGRFKLPRGRYVTVVATDLAGNRSRKAKKRFRVR
jgi:hypothetical protein